MDTPRLRQVHLAALVPQDTNAVQKMQIFLPCRAPRANSHFLLQQIVRFVPLDMPAEHRVMQDKSALLAPIRSLVTDFAPRVLLDSSALIHPTVPSYAPTAATKIKWDQRTAQFVLLVTLARIVLKSP